MSHEIIDYVNAEGKNEIAFELTSGKFSGVIYSYGEVSFPDENEPILHFEYVLHKGEIDNLDEFRDIIGDILVTVLEESMVNQSTVYYGGI
jgi:hypothetical protein